ncbi:uncharacterized protein TNCV_3668921 [Trichonephila clavipes]|nr:uncharacterized protein TNCV_3668921 [Trichonephila clavipes]
MIAASPLSPDEYAMRIATQTESALICEEYSSHSLLLHFRCSRHHRERHLRWAGVKGTHRTGRRANRPPPCCLLATVKRDIGRPVACVVYLAISPAVCRLFLLASNVPVICGCGSSWTTTTEPPDSCSCSLKFSPKS